MFWRAEDTLGQANSINCTLIKSSVPGSRSRVTDAFIPPQEQKGPPASDSDPTSEPHFEPKPNTDMYLYQIKKFSKK
jgi:hypothetical protein